MIRMELTSNYPERIERIEGGLIEAVPPNSPPTGPRRKDFTESYVGLTPVRRMCEEEQTALKALWADETVEES